ncbi:MAG: hypothetical protein HGA45_19615 [Chloroflexales bacterium]|nr:hypothetical protein [Chloroflexales bacterium]
MTATTAIAGQSDRWWLPLVEGILAILLGISFLINPAVTSVWFVLGLGFYWIMIGIIDIVRIFRDRDGWGWKLFSGILGIVAGLYIVSGMLGQNHPLGTAFAVGVAFTLVLAVMTIIYGVVGLIRAFQGGGWWPAVLGGLGICFGLAMLFNQMVTTMALPWSIGIVLIGVGIFLCVAAFRMR